MSVAAIAQGFRSFIATTMERLINQPTPESCYEHMTNVLQALTKPEMLALYKDTPKGARVVNRLHDIVLDLLDEHPAQKTQEFVDALILFVTRYECQVEMAQPLAIALRA